MNLIEKRSFSSPSLAQLVKKLRVSTGAPMVECKKALTSEDVNGDLEKAIQWLRQHGSAKVTSKMKAGGRDATEGLVGLIMLLDDNGLGMNNNDGVGGIEGAALIKIGSETDFASRSKVFTTLVEDVATATLVSHSKENKTGSVSVDVGESSPFWNVKLPRDQSTDSNEMTVKQAMEEAILSIRENLQMKEMHCIISANANNTKEDADMSILAGYVHGKTPHSQNAGTSAAVVELLKKTSTSEECTQEQLQEIGKKLAMHIVAAKPDYLSPEHVPTEIIEKEKEMIVQEIGDTGKPANIVEKMIQGKLRKFYEGVCLTEQKHLVEEENPKIAKFLMKKGLEVRSFQSVFI